MDPVIYKNIKWEEFKNHNFIKTKSQFFWGLPQSILLWFIVIFLNFLKFKMASMNGVRLRMRKINLAEMTREEKAAEVLRRFKV